MVVADGKPDTSNREPVERAWNYARAVDMAMAGATNAQIAQDVGVDKAAVRRYFASGEGQARLREAMSESVDRTSRFAQTAHSLALRTLVKAMNDAEKWSEKIAAARAVTALQTRRLELTGQGGGAIQVDFGVQEEVARLHERLEAILVRQDSAGELEPGDVEDAELVE